MVSTARVLWSVRLKSFPAVFRPIAHLRENSKRRLVRRDTDVVIEGYWRCGNHFATYAFMIAQGRPTRVAHHFHAPAQLMLAVRWGVPAVLLVREPVEAVASATVYLHKEDPGPFLKFYRLFHEVLTDLAPHIVVSDFPVTVGHFGAVIDALNARYGTHFLPFVGDAQQCAAVERMIREEHAENMGAGQAQLPLPSEAKSQLKRRVIERMHDSRYRPMLEKAQRLYDHFREFAVPAPAAAPASSASASVDGAGSRP
jgi:hypothetical protein